MAPYFSYTLNLIIVSLLATPILYCHLWGNPTIRGFYCDDESLDYPYHSSTIPSWALYFVGFGVPIVAIIGVEVTSFLKQTDHSDIKALVDILYPLIIGFLYGTATCQSLTDITKYTIGRLRPQFFDVCRPFYDLQDCGISPWHSDYVTNYTCQGNIDLFPVCNSCN
jgi:phosphatidate phosphatase